MRIGFDGGPLIDPAGGVGWHAYHLLRELLELKEDVEFVCYVPPGSLRSKRLPGWEAYQNVRWVEWPQLFMRWCGMIHDLDLYHGPNFKIRTTGRRGAVVTIHDLWLDRFPQYSPKTFGQGLSSLRTKRTAWRARKVIAVSHRTKLDIHELYGLPPERVAVIPNGISADFKPSPDRHKIKSFLHRFSVPTENFILFVGGADPRKNHRMLLEAYATRSGLMADYSLVMVGDERHRFGDIRATAVELGIQDRVVCTGRLDLTTLRLLYSHAEVFVFPSIYEGFGMPVLEAMACGAPVITSNTTALAEVAGDAAILVDSRDSDALAEAITCLLGDQKLRDEMKAKGHDRVRQFTWQRAARQTFDLYREVCSG